jgi:hypothetical protein
MNFVKNKQNTFENAVTNITNSIVTAQQTYIGYLSRVNTITYQIPGKTNTGTDGLQLKNGKVTSYIISGTTDGDTNTYAQLDADVNKVKAKIDSFNDIIWDKNSFSYNGVNYEGVLVFQTANGTYTNKFPIDQVFIPFSKNQNYITKSPSATFDNFIFRRVYMIVSDEVLDDKKYQTFKNALIGNILTNKELLTKGHNEDIGKVFDAYWLSIAKPLFSEENEITKAFVESLRKDKLASYLKYTETSKKRIFTFTTEGANTDAQKKLIKSLGATDNSNTDNQTWDTEDKSLGDVFISKVKLN